MIDFYWRPTPNGWMIGTMLEEGGPEFAVIPITIGKGGRFTPMPAVSRFRGAAGAGCLVGCGSSLLNARLVLPGLNDKVLNGAPPGETPARQPSTFELVIHQKAART